MSSQTFPLKVTDGERFPPASVVFSVMENVRGDQFHSQLLTTLLCELNLVRPDLFPVVVVPS